MAAMVAEPPRRGPSPEPRADPLLGWKAAWRSPGPSAYRRHGRGRGDLVGRCAPSVVAVRGSSRTAGSFHLIGLRRRRRRPSTVRAAGCAAWAANARWTSSQRGLERASSDPAQPGVSMRLRGRARAAALRAAPRLRSDGRRSPQPGPAAGSGASRHARASGSASANSAADHCAVAHRSRGGAAAAAAARAASELAPPSPRAPERCGASTPRLTIAMTAELARAPARRERAGRRAAR